MSLIEGDIYDRRAGRIVLCAVLLLAWTGSASAATLDQLYESARKADAAGRYDRKETAAAAIIARGADAIEFLAAKVTLQAERVGSAAEVEASGIRLTINLLGRMNSYPQARSALSRLKRHPVDEVGKWAAYALTRQPQTRPAGAATAPEEGPTAAQPAVPRREADRIVTDEGWFARPEVKRPALAEKITNAFVVQIREPITSKTFDALERKAVRCKAAGAELIIFDMDTWGGEVGAALDIARLLKTDLADSYKVCYARTRAVSAGALIALACNEIVMAPVGKLGDCAPLIMGGKLEGVEREKIETVLRTEFRESAQQNGYSVALSESMVSASREVWLIRNEITQQLQYVLRKDWRGRVRIPEGMAEGASDLMSRWELLRVTVAEGELLTMAPPQALEYGFASRIIPAGEQRPLQKLLEHYSVKGAATVLADNWSERLVEFLMSPAVVGFLLFVGLLCGYVEMHTPGFGVAGSIAILCFGLLFGGGFLTGLASWWEIAVFILGMVLLGIELFVTPGFGLMGVAGILCCVAALLAMVVPNPPNKLPWPETDLDWTLFKHGATALLAAFLAAIAAGAAITRFLPKVPVAGQLILAPPKLTGAPPATKHAQILAIKPGQIGKVVQICRPVGKVWIDEKLCDAIADGAFLPTGTTVVVLRNEGNRLVVEDKDQASTPTGGQA